MIPAGIGRNTGQIFEYTVDKVIQTEDFFIQKCIPVHILLLSFIYNKYYRQKVASRMDKIYVARTNERTVFSLLLCE